MHSRLSKYILFSFHNLYYFIAQYNKISTKAVTLAPLLLIKPKILIDTYSFLNTRLST